MADFITAYDSTTGQKLSHPVPVSWIANKVFPHIVASLQETQPPEAPTKEDEN